MPILSNFPCSNAGGSGVQLPPVSNIQTLTASGKVYIKWTDPDNVVVSDITLASWSGTLLVRKAGSAPTNRRDGIIVLDSKTKNAYQDSYLCDSGLADGVTYFYKFFSYTDTRTYTDTDDNIFSATPTPVPVDDVADISVSPSGNGKIAITWTDPDATVVEDGATLATWDSTIVVVKEGSYATSPTDDSAAFTYTSTTRNGHTITPLIATGLTNCTTYYVSLFPMSTDGKANTNTTNRKTGVANRIVISNIPTQSNSLTYNGNSQSPTWSNFDSTQLTLEYIPNETDAGTYEAWFMPTEDYQWDDGSTLDKSVTWSIGRRVVTGIPAPNITNDGFYNGEKQPHYGWYFPGELSDYPEDQFIFGGDIYAIDAGYYVAEFTPNKNYMWSDGGIYTINVEWYISPAEGNLFLDSSDVSLTDLTPTAVVTVTRDGDGAISATIDNTDIASVSVSDTAITITGKKTGTANITVSVGRGKNYYTDTTKTISVTAKFLPAKKALNDMTWAEIRQVSDAGLGDDYWNVGDRKAVTLNGTVGTLALNTTLYVYILGFNHNSAKEGSGIQFGTFKTALSGGTNVCLVDSIFGYSFDDGSKCFSMNHWGAYNYGGWKACDARYDILGSTKTAPKNYGKQHASGAVGYDAPTDTATSPVASTMMAALPADLRAVMKPITKYTDNVAGSTGDVTSNVTSSVDYLPLLSEQEIFGGNRTHSNQYEKSYQVQYTYYSAGNSKEKYQHSSTGSAAYWWERSPYYNGKNFFCMVDMGGVANYASAGMSIGLAPAFMV